MAERRKSKIPSRRIQADSCVVTDRGDSYYPHIGEWIEMRPLRSIQEQLDLLRLRELSTADGAEVGVTEARLLAICVALSKQIIIWNWTDDLDRPLGQPHECPEVLMALSNEELTWIITQAITTETEGERKNA